jgi:co-chaperonin GroES (HSP10)
MPNDGSSLARGGRSAQFQAPAREKEGTDVFHQVVPLAEEIFDPGPVPELVAEVGVQDYYKEKPAVGYRGNAKGDNVLLLRVDKEHTSNLIIPDSMKSRSDIGFIVSVGQKVVDYNAGQLVLFDRFASHGSDVELIDEEGILRKYLLLREYDIMLELEKIQL